MKNEQYLFNWNKVPENDNDKLIKFLKVKFKIKWEKEAKIEKIDDDRTIMVSADKNYILLKLNDEKTIVKLESYNSQTKKKRTDELKAKIENGVLNIYKEHINVRILRTLLEKPKSTGEVAIALEYAEKKDAIEVVKINGKNINKTIVKNVILYKNVRPALKLLEKTDRLIKRFRVDKKTFGIPSSTYDIVYNRGNIKKILEEYPDLRPDLQKNDKVIKILIDEHKWIIDDYRRTIFKVEHEWNSSDELYMIKPFQQELTEKLITSSTFFRLFVNNSSEVLQGRFYGIIIIESENKLLEPKNCIIKILEISYEACVYSDILNGEQTDEAIEYIIGVNRINLIGENGRPFFRKYRLAGST